MGMSRISTFLPDSLTNPQLFIVEGAMTVGLALIFAFLLPNSHKRIIGLSEIECEWVQWNFEKDLGQQDNSDEITAWQGLVMAVKDPKTWLLMSILYLCYIDGTVVNFFPSVVKTLGFDRNTTYALTAPPFILAVITMLFVGFHSDKVRPLFPSLDLIDPLSEARSILAHRHSACVHCHRQRHRCQHPQHRRSIRCHDAPSGLLLLLRGRHPGLDLRFSQPAKGQASCLDLAHQLRL